MTGSKLEIYGGSLFLKAYTCSRTILELVIKQAVQSSLHLTVASYLSTVVLSTLGIGI